MDEKMEERNEKERRMDSRDTRKGESMEVKEGKRIKGGEGDEKR